MNPKWMRNVLLIPALALTLTACEDAPAPTGFCPTLDDSYAVHAVMDYGEDAQATLDLTRYAAGEWEAVFAEPASLSGVMLTFEGSAVSASYKGLAFTVPKSALPAKTMLLLVTDVLDALDTLEEIPCTTNDDGSRMTSGESEGGSYTVTFDADGKLQGFAIPSQPLTVTFTEYHEMSTSGDTSDTGDTTTTSGNNSDTTTTMTTTATTATKKEDASQ